MTDMEKKKLIPLLALAAAILSSCGPTGTTTESSFDPLDEGDLVRDEAGNIVYDGVELKMWSVTTGDDASTQDAIIAGFNDLYEGQIHVTTTHTSRYDLETLLNTTMQFDRPNAPDLLFNHGSRAAEYRERGWLLPVDNYFGKAETPLDKDDFVPSLLNAVTLDGSLYGLPMDVHSAMVVMRVDILEKNGYEIPTNYEELVAICDDAAKKAANNQLWIRGENSEGYAADEWRLASTASPYAAFPISYGDMWVHEFVGYTAAVQNGASVVDEEGMPAWNSDETAKGLQLLRDWIFPSATSYNKSALSLDYGSSYDVGNAPLLAGTAMFKLQGPWAYMNEMADFDRLLRNDGGADNITTRSLSGLFTRDDSEASSLIKGEGHAIMMMAPEKFSLTKACAATVFMDYMAYYSGIEWAKRGHLPAAISVSNSSAFKADPAYEEYIQYWGQPEDYVVVPPTVNYTYIDTYFKNALQQTLSSSYQNQTVKAILEDQYEDCVSYIELYA